MQHSDFLSVVAIFGGLVLLLYGLSFFLFPIAAVILGLLLINYGLQLRNGQNLLFLARKWFFRMR